MGGEVIGRVGNLFRATKHRDGRLNPFLSAVVLTKITSLYRHTHPLLVPVEKPPLMPMGTSHLGLITAGMWGGVRSSRARKG